MPEAEVVPFMDLDRMQSITNNQFHKFPWAHQRKITRERNHSHGIDSCLFQQPNLLGARSQKLQSRIRTQNPHGVRIEGHRDRPSMSLLGSRLNLIEHPNMSPMHSVEISNADQRRPEVSRYLLEFMKNLH